MKRILIFLIVGLVMFGLGFGGGLFLGRSMAPSGDATGAGGREISKPGPIVSLGEFTSNLAGAGRHITSFTLSLEMVNNPKALAELQDAGWLVRIRNEVLLVVKDKVYDDLVSAEGALQLAGDIKRSLNSILPDVAGEAPVVNVLFESLIVQ